MTLFFISFIAGVLTILAPCILPLLPVIIGGSVSGQERRSPFLITASLAVSIVLFTLLLKVSTAFIDIPQSVWRLISGVIVLVFGMTSLFPGLWETVASRFNFSAKTSTLLVKSSQKKNRWGDVLMGAALGPVFSSCSPTYFVILASVLPEKFAIGLLYLIAYAVGLAAILLPVAYLGQRFVKRLAWATDPHGWFKRGLGVLFILVGILIVTGVDKKLQTALVQRGYFDITKVELKLLEGAEETK